MSSFNEVNLALRKKTGVLVKRHDGRLIPSFRRIRNKWIQRDRGGDAFKEYNEEEVGTVGELLHCS
jgi:hypothetical protein